MSYTFTLIFHTGKHFKRIIRVNLVQFSFLCCKQCCGARDSRSQAFLAVAGALEANDENTLRVIK